MESGKVNRLSAVGGYGGFDGFVPPQPEATPHPAGVLALAGEFGRDPGPPSETGTESEPDGRIPESETETEPDGRTPETETEPDGRPPDSESESGSESDSESESEIVPWPLTAEGIRGAVDDQKQEIKHCYEQWLKLEPDIAGRVVVTFTIAGDEDDRGRVTDVDLAESELEHTFMEGCVLNVFGELPFEAPEGGGEVEVNYPLMFASEDETG